MQRSRRWIPITIIIFFALSGGLGAKGIGGLIRGCGACMRVAAPAVRAAVVVAALVGRAVALAYHDAHHHSDECGHYRRQYDRHWVYHYQNRWEYEQDGRWYAYSGQGAPPAPAPAPHAPPPIVAGPQPPAEPAIPGVRGLLEYLRTKAGGTVDEVRAEVERVCGALPELKVTAGCRRFLPNEHFSGEICAYFCVHHCAVHVPNGVVLAEPLPPRVSPFDAQLPDLGRLP